MKRYLSLDTREMQIKTTIKYNFIPTRMAIKTTKQNKKNPQKITSISKNVEKLESSYIAGGNDKWCRDYGKQFSDSSKS